MKQTTLEEVRESDIDLREDELLEQDWGESEELDDSLERIRPVRVLAVDKGEEARLGLAARERRTWEVVPLRKNKASNATK